MRIAVTGGLGFIGQSIVRELIIRRHTPIVVDFWKNRITEYEKDRHPIVEQIYADSLKVEEYIEPYEFIHRIKSMSVDAVIHAGAVVDTMDLGDKGLWELNVDYTRDLVAGMIPRSIPMVFLSSAATYGQDGYPKNPYGLSKLLAEKIVSDLTRYSILRLFNVFGPLEHHKGPMASVVFKLVQAYKNGTQFELHSPDSSRDFVPVSAVVTTAINRAQALVGRRLDDIDRHEIYDVGTGLATSFADLDVLIQKAMVASQSVVKIIPLPEHLEGRYQFFTQAGQWRNMPDMTNFSTKQWINEYFRR